MQEADAKAKKNARLEDIAREAGVSISTVSRALNDSPAVKRRTKQDIWKIARAHDYDFRSHMPNGPVGAEATIAVIVPAPQARETRVADPFFLELLAGIAEAARERNADLVISHVAPSSAEDLEFAMTTSRATGMIFIGQSSLHDGFNALADRDDRFVVWGAEFPDAQYCTIGSDNVAGGRRATSHLLRLGRKRVLFLGDTEAPEAEQRFRGYRQALREADIELVNDLVVPAHFDVHSGEVAARSAINRGIEFDGIFAASDLIAIGAIRALTLSGRSVPDDISVVGYDNIPAARLVTPRLTTIDQDTNLAGRMLVSKLIDTKGGKATSQRLETSLLIRDSCGG
ncbi:LacI family DNA-binding transcriptional regulator [Erythrobacter crassostreae]|uniref:LacI family DNA-binding transcriptional regulator n=1 Tax=Erythrobacter crassostreae TaxID=2828328 RepID=A0A9X1F6H4_9SPHN|nr:LacI family DNA-binding transcriptional regulator [Erythrobacter crassostrea]MBV7260353.1 LacI family DNA-binding transcriptional regulator [Erythrobacter crassostrea]